MEKKCSKCGRVLDLSFFALKNGKPVSICKDCKSEYDKQRYLKIREKRIEQSLLYYINNKDKIAEYNIKNKERIKIRRHINYLKNIEKHKKHNFDYYHLHKETVILNRKIWGKENSFLNKIYRKVATAKRRCRGEIKASDLKEMLKKQNNKCDYCGVELDEYNIQLDHIKPVSKGGDNSLDNLHFVCKNCNLRKYTREEEEFKKIMNLS